MYRWMILIDGSNQYPLSDIEREVTVTHAPAWDEKGRTISGGLARVTGPIKRRWQIRWNLLSDEPVDGGVGHATLESLANNTTIYTLRVYSSETNYQDYQVMITGYEATPVSMMRREIWSVTMELEEV